MLSLRSTATSGQLRDSQYSFLVPSQSRAFFPVTLLTQHLPLSSQTPQLLASDEHGRPLSAGLLTPDEQQCPPRRFILG